MRKTSQNTSLRTHTFCKTRLKVIVSDFKRNPEINRGKLFSHRLNNNEAFWPSLVVCAHNTEPPFFSLKVLCVDRMCLTYSCIFMLWLQATWAIELILPLPPFYVHLHLNQKIGLHSSILGPQFCPFSIKKKPLWFLSGCLCSPIILYMINKSHKFLKCRFCHFKLLPLYSTSLLSPKKVGWCPECALNQENSCEKKRRRRNFDKLSFELFFFSQRRVYYIYNWWRSGWFFFYNII